MKVIDKVFIDQPYRRENFDIHDFDQLKEEFRAAGITSAHATIICDGNLYSQIENVMLDHCFGLQDDSDDYQDVSKGRNVIRKNGLTWLLKRCAGLPDWTMIIIPDKIDLR